MIDLIVYTETQRISEAYGSMRDFKRDVDYFWVMSRKDLREKIDKEEKRKGE